MASIKSFAPATNTNHEQEIYSDKIKRSGEIQRLATQRPDTTERGEYVNQPSKTNPGWFFNGNNWEFNEALYYGY